MSYTYEYPKHDLTATVLAYANPDPFLLPPEQWQGHERLAVLGIVRGLEPFKGKLALPGGFKELTETLEEAAYREFAREEVPNINDVCKHFGHNGVYGSDFKLALIQSNPDRDPRSKTSGAPVVDTVWRVQLPWEVLTSGMLKGGDDAVSVVFKLYEKKDFVGNTAAAYKTLRQEWAFDHGDSIWQFMVREFFV